MKRLGFRLILAVLHWSALALALGSLPAPGGEPAPQPPPSGEKTLAEEKEKTFTFEAGDRRDPFTFRKRVAETPIPQKIPTNPVKKKIATRKRNWRLSSRKKTMRKNVMATRNWPSC